MINDESDEHHVPKGWKIKIPFREGVFPEGRNVKHGKQRQHNKKKAEACVFVFSVKHIEDEDKGYCKNDGK